MDGRQTFTPATFVARDIRLFGYHTRLYVDRGMFSINWTAKDEWFGEKPLAFDAIDNESLFIYARYGYQ